VPDRADRPLAPRPMRLNHFTICSVISVKCQPFFGFTQSFCYNISHFATVNSAIMLQSIQLFCYSQLNHFCYSAQSFFDCYNALVIPRDTMLSHSSYYSAQSFLITPLLSHFPLLQYSVVLHCKRCSVIPRCYNTQSFLLL
jgi:hypothetical protein